MFYRLFRLLARVMLKLFFRRIEVEGRRRVPTAGPVLFVANHTNALVDPLFLMITLRRRVTLTAKNVLGQNPLSKLLMSALGIVKFHRSEDVGKGADRRENVRSLDQCLEILRQGGAVCIFPEGLSHSDSQLRRFHTGAARLALDYIRAVGNPGNLVIVPVGLFYTNKDKFRSDVWLRYGSPVDVSRWIEQHPQADVRALTDDIRSRIEDLTLNFETRRESLILTWTAEVLGTAGTAPAPLGWIAPPLAQDFQLIKRLQTGSRTLSEVRPEEVNALTKRVRQYRGELKRLGIEPREVYLPIHFGKASFFLLRELELLLIGAPLALFGAINHFIPYFIVKFIASALSKDKDHWATNVVYPSLLVFPICYALQIAAAWWHLPSFWACLYTLLLPYTGYLALLYGDRAGATQKRLRTFLYFLFHRSKQSELASEGRNIIAEIRGLQQHLPADAAGAVGVRT